MAFFVRKLGSEKRARKFLRQLVANHARSQHQDVGIVVFNSLMGRIGIVTKPGSDARNLIRRHRHSDSAAADQYSSFGALLDDGLSHGDGNVRVIHGRLAKRSDIFDLVPQLSNIRYEHFLQCKSA